MVVEPAVDVRGSQVWPPSLTAYSSGCLRCLKHVCSDCSSSSASITL